MTFIRIQRAVGRVRRYSGRWGRDTGRCRRGVALVEFAVVAPILLLLVFGIIEFAQLMFIRQSMINAAASGARAALLPGASTERVVALTRSALDDGGLQGVEVEITHTSEPVDPQTGQGEEEGEFEEAADTIAETVNVRLNYEDVSLLGTYLLPENYQLESECTMYRSLYR